MKSRFFITVCLVAATIAGCSSNSSIKNEKKVMIMASGKITVTDKTIALEPSFSHNEQEVVFTDDKLTLGVKSTDGTNKTFDLSENGIYLLNLQKDTLIGGTVNYGTSTMPATITGEQLDHIIDSTQQLMQGLNASDAKGSFFIPPFVIKKVSSKSNARVIGSFKGIPYQLDKDSDGNVPDVIKFFTNKQKRETLDDLKVQREKIKER
jgi:uncharacterized protein YcfL